MSGAAKDGVIFEPRELLPAEWQALPGGGPVRTFNPGLLRDGDGWIFAYRVVLPDGARRIGVCRLDGSFRVINASPLAFSDRVQFRPGATYPEVVTRWFADPRLYRFGARLFIYWNSGWHEPRNYQFLQELDPQTLLPLGAPRELVLRGERQKLEKNWTFFAEPGTQRLLALYSITPHRVLELFLAGDGDIPCSEIANVDWSIASYPPHHGGLRGGAPPCEVEGGMWVFCHSVHDSPHGYRYAPAVYCFAPTAPFRPICAPVRPIELPNPFGARRAHPHLNPAVGEVVYPCGAAHESGNWTISYGLNDERCAIATIPHLTVQNAVAAVATTG